MNVSEHVGFFIQEMTRRNFRKSTIETYSSCAKVFFQKSTKDHPKNINEDDIRQFLIAYKSANQRAYHSAIKKFYEICLHQKQKFRYIPYARKERRLPIVLSTDEMQRL